LWNDHFVAVGGDIAPVLVLENDQHPRNVLYRGQTLRKITSVLVLRADDVGTARVDVAPGSGLRIPHAGPSTGKRIRFIKARFDDDLAARVDVAPFVVDAYGGEALGKLGRLGKGRWNAHLS